MRKLWAMIRTEFMNEFSSPISVIFFLVLPLLFTAAVSAGLQGMYRDDAPPQEVRTPIYVKLDDTGPLVDALLDALVKANLDPEVVETVPENSFALEVPPDFSELLQSDATASLVLHVRPDSSASPAVEQAVMAARGRVGGAALVARAGVEQARANGIVETDDEAERWFRDVLAETLAATQTPPAVVDVSWPEGVAFTETRDMATSAEQASAGQMVSWVQITLLGAAEVLVAERLGGTLRRMLVAPTSRSLVLGGKLVARLAMGLLQMALLLVGGALLFGVGWDRHPWAVVLVSFTFGLAVVSLGILVATFVRTQGQASSVVVAMAMAMAALGGAWFPLEITPHLYRQVAQILPSTWAMRAYTDVLARGSNLVDILPYAGILTGFAIAFSVAAAWRFRHYQEV